MSSAWILPVSLSLLASLAGSSGQILLRLQGNHAAGSSAAWLYSAAAALSFTLVLGLLGFAYRLGGSVAVVAPLYGMTFVWSPLIGAYFERAPLAPGQCAALLLMTLGIVLSAVYGRPVAR